jgi:GT2 family glycosyltransferase
VPSAFGRPRKDVGLEGEGALAKRITVGLPVYKGAEHIAKTLRCLQEQTYRDFDAIISVDGNDLETAEVCRPFLSDARFRLVVQPERLDWFGNFNWLLQQDLNEFFCYRQHDDTTAPDFFEVLLRTADESPQAAAVYCDCQWQGGRSDLEIAPSIEGEPLERLLQHVEQLHAVAVRGLIRREAVAQAGPVRPDEFRALCGVFVWLAKVLRWGSFLRVPEPLYYRLDHADNYHKQWSHWPEEKRRAMWTTMFTGMMEAIMPVCATAEERLFAQHAILDRVVTFRPERPYLYIPSSPHSSGQLISECLQRLSDEGSLDLLEVGELPAFLQARVRLRELSAETARLKDQLARLNRSRMLIMGRRIRHLLGRAVQ